ncbi:DUF6773 family protein [Salisediminibacterium beveridgei]|uniref:DUF6773 family protein n=1 Tax=Salisediminibacterium beveridgei TaxID=632773 RepID=UPI0008481036|nr:DUF6773 family protein [Salisediminibacterium beveridgei]
MADIKAENRRITAEAFYLLFFGLFLILGYQILIEGEPIMNHLDSLILFISASLYITFRTVWFGKAKGDLKDRKGFFLRNIITALVASLLFTGVMIYLSGVLDFPGVVLEFFIFFLMFIGVSIVLQRLLFRKFTNRGVNDK